VNRFKYIDCDDVRERVWKSLVETKPKPPMATKKRISLVKEIIWDSEDFWWDMLDRHGLGKTLLEDLENDIRIHAIGNFWGQVCQCIIERIITKNERI